MKKKFKKSRQRPTNMDWQMSLRMVSIQAWRRTELASGLSTSSKFQLYNSFT